jgi:SAM-dependent methyltransferase
MKIMDVGCGPGIYVKALREAGVEADGVDIDPGCPYLIMDIFSAEFEMKFAGKYDLAMCIEVAEHLPESKANSLVDVLTKLAPTVLFSAAVPGQGGHGHINCQPKEYWINKFAEVNYVVDAEATSKLLTFITSGYHMGWFRNNAVVFKQYGAACYARIIEEETPQAIRLAEYLSQNKL